MDSATGATYYVNPEGQRLRKIGALGTTFFAPDHDGPMLAEYIDGGWVDYIWVNGRLIGRAAGGQVYAVHADQLGRPESATNASRSIVWSANNFAFDRQVVTEGFKFNLGFPGQYYDVETNTWNNGYRDYRADLGRYVESDPVGLDGGLNTYTYVRGNPISLYDTWGLTQADIDCMLALAKKAETDLKFPKTDPVVRDMATHEDSSGGQTIDVGEYNAFNGKMYLSSVYLQQPSGDQLVDLYDTIVHEALHKTRGPFSGLGAAHRAVYKEANRRSSVQASNIKSGAANCDCGK
jgi:RHS repeat-associated protein